MNTKHERPEGEFQSHNYFDERPRNPKFDHSALLKSRENVIWDAMKNNNEGQLIENMKDRYYPDIKAMVEQKGHAWIKGEFQFFTQAAEKLDIRSDLMYFPANFVKGDAQTDLIKDGLHVYKKTLVHLNEVPVEEMDDEHIQKTFVNANYITNPFTDHPEDFIASASPTHAGIPGFLNMLILKTVVLALTLCQPHEISTDVITKCNRYFPDKEGETMHFGSFSVTTLSILEHNSYQTTRVLEITDSERQERHTMQHIHFFGFKDGASLVGGYETEDGNKVDSNTVLEQIETVMRTIEEIKTAHQHYPVLVHCSAGIGRTGTFISMYYLRQQVLQYVKEIKKRQKSKREKVKKLFYRSANSLHEVPFSVFKVAVAIREQRHGSIQSHTQYIDLYRYLKMMIDYEVEHF